MNSHEEWQYLQDAFSPLLLIEPEQAFKIAK